MLKMLKEITWFHKQMPRKINFTFSLVWRDFPPAKGLVGLKKVRFFWHWKLDILPHLESKIDVFLSKMLKDFHFSIWALLFSPTVSKDEYEWFEFSHCFTQDYSWISALIGQKNVFCWVKTQLSEISRQSRRPRRPKQMKAPTALER